MESTASPRSPREKRSEPIVTDVKQKNAVDTIDTKGTPVTHPAGGKLIFRCVEVKGKC